MKIVVEGMSCAHCTARVTKALEQLGLTDVQVDLASQTATANGTAPDDAVKSAIEDVGFTVRLIDEQ